MGAPAGGKVERFDDRSRARHNALGTAAFLLRKQRHCPAGRSRVHSIRFVGRPGRDDRALSRLHDLGGLISCTRPVAAEQRPAAYCRRRHPAHTAAVRRGHALMRPTPTRPAFDRIARPYRWLEYLSFGPLLERCRFYRLPQLADARRALILGDGDGRFLARLLTMNLYLQADIVDLSPAMLRLLKARIASTEATARGTLHCADARDFIPTDSYDLVVTHFFLDCFTTEDLFAMAARIRPRLTPEARWIVSEFAIPS